MDFSFLQEVTQVFAIAIALVFICARFRLPSIVGFLLTGILVGPHGLSLISGVHEIELLAEIGVVFLLFTIGLELSIGELIRLRYTIFVGGLLQVVFTSVVTLGIVYIFGLSFSTSLILGFIISLSSTAVVLKVFQSKGAVDSPHGKIVLSTLIFQDLAIVPMVLLVPFLSGTLHNIGIESLLLVGKLVLLILLFFAGRKIIPWVLRQLMIRTQNKEVLLLAILVLCLSVSFITSAIGLSLSLGAFLAGLLISESEYSLSSLEGVLPFKDVFTSLFFISVGMLFNIHFAIENMGMLIFVTSAVVLVKSAVMVLIGMLLRYPPRTTIIAALSLAQIGEFSFILAKSALLSSLLSDTEYQYVLGASIITMIITPFLINAAPRCAMYLVEKKWISAREEIQHSSGEESLDNHIIIVGYGVAGKRVAKAAKKVGIPYTILELNPRTVQELLAVGENIHYGDATQIAMLEALHIEKARTLVVLIPDPTAVKHIVTAVAKKYPTVRIIVRTRFLGAVRELHDLGASIVIAEECEVSISLFANVLMQYHLPLNDINALVDETRKEQYDALYFDSDNAPFKRRDIGVALGSQHILTLRVEQHVKALRNTVKDLALRQRFNVNIIAVVRDGSIVEDLNGDTIFQAGDVVYFFGNPEALIKVRELFLEKDVII